MERNYYLKIKALAIAIDRLLADDVDENMEDVIILSGILVCMLKEFEK